MRPSTLRPTFAPWCGGWASRPKPGRGRTWSATPSKSACAVSTSATRRSTASSASCACRSTTARYLERILAAGERVDGSSLFPGLFRHRRQRPLRRAGLPLGVPQSLGRGRAGHRLPLRRPPTATPSPADAGQPAGRGGRAASAPTTGAELQALAELEFYLILDRDDDRFSGKAQRNYHQSAPYLHGRAIADEILRKVERGHRRGQVLPQRGRLHRPASSPTSPSSTAAGSSSTSSSST